MSHFTVWVDFEDKSTNNAEDSMNLTAVKLLGRNAVAECHIAELMEPFCESTEDPEYLEFENVDEEYRPKYEAETVDCVRLPNGSIYSVYDSAFKKLYTAENGIVYKKEYGPLHHKKRTKKSRQIRFLPHYPVKKLFKTYGDYVEDFCGYEYHEDQGAYGYYTNPNSFWDWYQIGGRWPFAFLVKAGCRSSIDGERSWLSETAASASTPEGYVWAAGARKSDIAWDAMREQAVKEHTERFAVLESCFRAGRLPESNMIAHIVEDGIQDWQVYLYKKDETLKQYLERHDLGPDCKYPCSPYGYVSNGEYCSQGDMGWWAISTNEKDENVWRAMVQKYIEEMPEDHLLVSLDCHV